jgi:hypothetical protein
VLLCAVGLAVAPGASAVSGSVSDPQSGPVGADIQLVSHDDTATEIIYTLELYGPVPRDSGGQAVWVIDTNEASVPVDLDSGSAGFACEDAVPATTSFPASDVLQVRFPRAALEECVGSSYSYHVFIDDPATGRMGDVSPEIVHTLTPVSTSSTSSSTTSTTAGSSTTSSTVPSSSSTSTSSTSTSSTTSTTRDLPFDPPTPDLRQLDATPRTVPAGGTVTVTGHLFVPRSRVDLTLHSAPVRLGSVTADDVGTFVATVRIPRGTAQGQHRVVATGTGNDGLPRAAEVTITVRGHQLARTGTTVPTRLLVTCFAGGVAFLAFARRRELLRA